MQSDPGGVLPSKQNAPKALPPLTGSPACLRRPPGSFLSNSKRATSARPGWRLGWALRLEASSPRSSFASKLKISFAELRGQPLLHYPLPLLKARAAAPPQSEPLCRAPTLGLLLQLSSSHPGIALPKCSCSQEFFLVQGSRPAVLLGVGGVKPGRQLKRSLPPYRHPRGKRRAILLRTIAAVAWRFPTETGEQSAP